jgi:hypothetical protein
MDEIRCKKCSRGCCPIRKSQKREGDILILSEIITHEDGSKERREYGRVNEKTNQIISMAL